MSRRSFRAALSMLACVLAASAQAEALNAKTGAWEMTITSVTTGTPVPAAALAKMSPEQRARMEATMQSRSGKPSTQVEKSCLTQEDLDKDRLLAADDEGDCAQKVISRSPTKTVLERTCAEPDPSHSTMTIETRTPESIAATIDMAPGGSSGSVHVDIVGRWLGASCAGLDDED